MPFSDLPLARRLERAEGHACVQYAHVRRTLFPTSGAEWIECAGTYAVFDGIDSPVTQSFGLGLFEQLTPASLDLIERFFIDRGAPVIHEVSPFAGVAALELLCARNYRPVELSTVLCRTLAQLTTEHHNHIRVRVIGPEESQLWTQIHVRGWAHEHPELRDFVAKAGVITSGREDAGLFLAELDGVPGAAGVLCLHDGVALCGGSATIPELRHRGLHQALLDERLRYAFERGCDLGMMAAEPGSNSQRNAQRKQFQIAYTRTKWRLAGHSLP
jgi:GNAT superfamily N-acetyltransferase